MSISHFLCCCLTTAQAKLLIEAGADTIVKMPDTTSHYIVWKKRKFIQDAVSASHLTSPPIVDVSNRATQIIDTIKEGDLDAVSSLLQSKVSASWTDRDGFPLLMYARFYGESEIAKLLVKNKANPALRPPDSYCRDALKFAIREDCFEMCRFLLSCPGVTPNWQDNHSQPLCLAVSESRLNMARLLLEAKADPNLNSEKGNFALRLAILQGNRKMLNLLLQYGADPNKATPEHGSRSLLDAIDKKDIVITHMLVDAKADVDHRNAYGEVPIRYAMRANRVEMLKVLVKHTAHINKSYKIHFKRFMGDATPLLFAIERQSQDLVETVLQCKADVNQPNSKGMTPLLMTVKMNYIKLVRDAW